MVSVQNSQTASTRLLIGPILILYTLISWGKLELFDAQLQIINGFTNAETINAKNGASSSLFKPNQQSNPASSVIGISGRQQDSVLPLPLSSREAEKAIVDRILGDGYDKRIRPAGSTIPSQQQSNTSSKLGTDGPTIVKVNTLVRSISKIDDVTMEYSVQLSLRQEWTDDRLAFGKMRQYKDYGLNSITLTEQERIWKPDLFFRNEKEGHFHKIIMPNVLLRIKGEGQVLYSIRISLVLACPMDLKYYPLDKQNCTIEMASYGYLDEDLKFMWKEVNPVQIAKPLNLPRFTLETYETAYCTSRTTTGAYSCLRIDLIFKREFSYYLIQIYIPCCMLVIVSWVSFWLDPNAIPARVSLGVTTLLTMATQISGINASLPPVSYTKAIDVWTGVCLTFVFGALLEFALVNYASRSDQHKREMLTSQLTHTQQLRWREATAAAAAAGTAPPTSPPPDENSPSMQARKQGAFFPNHASYNHLAGLVQQPQSIANMLGAYQNNPLTSSSSVTTATTPTTTTNANTLPTGPRAASTTGNLLTRSLAATFGSNQHNSSNNNNNGQQHIVNGAKSNSNQNGQLQNNPPSSQAIANNLLMMNHGVNQHHRPMNAATNHAHCQQLQSRLAKGIAPKTNCPVHNWNSSFDLDSKQQQMDAPRRRRNWCKMWSDKFPSKSKKIDVISRIAFPLLFAFFNLIYWTTYLFREEEVTY